ncbi:hypothetical protein IDZ74_29360 [Pseudomonas aeruginosa]|uniref:hypothetical protein n=1 Tax=Pseudomonas aeruginosa TaxID=287 RepID=UPI001ADAB6B6|nr:hypothetical protein [Pseudomonas aeruginosa]MBO8406755.1 hypothetical protein [Pseudomonas aeruginosa]
MLHRATYPHPPTPPRDGHGDGLTREQIAAAFGVPLESLPEKGARQAAAEVFAQAWRDLGRAMAYALRLPDYVARLARALDRSEQARQRLRGLVERNATRPRLTVRRDDLRAVLDELDAHRARLAAGGEQ